MAEDEPPQSKEDHHLDSIPTMLLPRSPAQAKPLPNTTAPPSGAAPQTFHRFPDLAPELRIAIWELSLPQRVHTYPPRRSQTKYDFLKRRWWTGKVFSEKLPAIAHACSESRAVALSSCCLMKTLLCHGNHNQMTGLCIDSRRDTTVMNTGQNVQSLGSVTSHACNLLSSKDIHIALDVSWAMCLFMGPTMGIWMIPIQIIYDTVICGRKQADFVVLNLELDVTVEEAADTGLFGNSDENDNALIPIEDRTQMSRLFDAQARFHSADRLDKWQNFTQHRKSTNLVEFIRRWKKLATREKRKVQKGLDSLAGLEVGRRGKNADQIRDQIAWARKIRAEQPKLRPVIMVSRGFLSSRANTGNE